MVGKPATGQTGMRPQQAPPFIGYALVRVAHLLNQKMDRGLADLELSANAFGVLCQLQGDPDVSSAELARRVILTPQSVGPLLAKMARDGLVEREQKAGPGTAITTRITPKAGTDAPRRRRTCRSSATSSSPRWTLLSAAPWTSGSGTCCARSPTPRHHPVRRVRDFRSRPALDQSGALPIELRELRH